MKKQVFAALALMLCLVLAWCLREPKGTPELADGCWQVSARDFVAMINREARKTGAPLLTSDKRTPFSKNEYSYQIGREQEDMTLYLLDTYKTNKVKEVSILYKPTCLWGEDRVKLIFYLEAIKNVVAPEHEIDWKEDLKVYEEVTKDMPEGIVIEKDGIRYEHTWPTAGYQEVTIRPADSE